MSDPGTPPVSNAAPDPEPKKGLSPLEHGTVLVSPCISSGEKEIARAALEAGLPLIVLVENGFSPLYKPPGRYFDACAKGRLLMLAPFPYHRDRRTITREQCLTLNEWAKAIVEPHGLGKEPTSLTGGDGHRHLRPV